MESHFSVNFALFEVKMLSSIEICRPFLINELIRIDYSEF